ncbi:MAG: ATP phosphoribosyltransferase [Clostridia bacterium]|nr:ATP phosphoribosyltransferase [Clostridia bacterium]
MPDFNAILQTSEKIIFTLRALYASYGYQPYRMSKFEEYDLYAKNKDFLLSDNVITFTDTTGKLMALKPDVTLSIIKNSHDLPDEVQKVYYNENVYRVSKGTQAFKEMMQAGLECFGRIGEENLLEVLSLAAESLKTLSGKSMLSVSCLDLSDGLIQKMGLSAPEKKQLYQAVSECNLHEMDQLCPQGEALETLKQLVSLSGEISAVLPRLASLLPENNACAAFCSVMEKLAQGPLAPFIRIDFSVTDDVNYYNGIVFKGYVRGIPDAVLSGGQYDRLMKKLHRKSHAIGFAVYTDLLDRLEDKETLDKAEDDFVNVALPKGRLGEKIYKRFAAAGYECPALLEPNRRLIFENAEKKVRYFWVKPSDVAIYVERGAADMGVAGKDILLEYQPDIFELMDLDTGKCRMAVAGPKGFTDDTSRTLKVATKFSNIARTFYQSRGRDIDIIHLNGSIELAPILGLSDVIVDIVETGATLKENDLEVIETIVPISARLIANRSSCKFKKTQIEKIVSGLKEAMEDKQ